MREREGRGGKRREGEVEARGGDWSGGNGRGGEKTGREGKEEECCGVQKSLKIDPGAGVKCNPHGVDIPFFCFVFVFFAARTD